MLHAFASALQDLPPQYAHIVGEFFITVGTAVGAPAHIAKVTGGVISVVTACGIGTGGMLTGLKVFWPAQISCEDCQDKYTDQYPSVSDWSKDKDNG